MLLSTTISRTLDLSFCVLGCCVMYYMIRLSRRIPKGLRLPPGPPGRPIIGNLTDMPVRSEWETIAKWGEQYGDLVHVNVLGRSMVYVNSFNIARDLFERRSSVYADRPELPMLTLSGWGDMFIIMRYGQQWRRHRRAFHQYFNSRKVSEYNPVQMKHTRALLQKVHDSPDNFVEHIKHFAAAIIIEVVYGIQLQPQNDRYIEVAHAAMKGASEAAVPGAFLVNMFPVLKHVPEWMPGAGFKTKARKWREPTIEMVGAPFMAVKNALANGTAGPSVMASSLKSLIGRDHAADEEETIRNTCGASYAAGAGTSVTGLEALILALVLHPEVQQKAQMEVDTVIGEDRLPTFEDRTQLPYVNALCEEVQRWRPVLPLGVPHTTSKDDVYGEFFIPKGSTVIGNVWAILHSEVTYGPRPEQFEPERFLRPGISLSTVQFGFGRRICPGRYMAGDTLFILAACLLKVFNITPAKDTEGNEIPIAGSFTARGAMLEPDPFKCSFYPRSASAQRLISKGADV